MTAGRILIGTSGWHYASWLGVFYPSGTRAAEFLAFYGQRFPTVEINNSFYQLPARKTLARWRQAVPASFVFAVKASGLITHGKKLRAARAPLRLFLSRVKTLGKKLGPVLFQLPPHWHFHPERLAAFLDALPRGLPAVFEFRDASWWRAETFALLRRHGAAFCMYHMQGQETPLRVIGNTAYVRFHGPLPGYAGHYTDALLRPWARRIRAWSRQGRRVFCYFNNDGGGWAVRDALRLRSLLRLRR